MAQDITLQGASYSDVPSVVLPKTGGGTASFTDVTDTTAVASDVASGKYFYLASGEKVAGTSSGGGGGSVTQDANGYIVLSDDSGTNVTLINKSITENGTYSASNDGADGYSNVTVNVSGGSEVLYVYSDLDGNGVVSTTGYGYVSCDFAPVNDGKFRFWIDVDSSDLTFKAPVSVPTSTTLRYTGRIDWGDGSTQTDYEYGNVDHTHTYSEPGRYCVSIWRTGGAERLSIRTPSSADAPKVVAYELFLIGYPTNTIDTLQNVRKIRYSSAQTEISFPNYTNLADVVLPDSATSISTCYNCTALRKLVIPSSVETISGGAFSGNTAMKEYHFLSTVPPTLGNTSVFNNIPSNCVIYVPSASLSDYQTADKWSTYASYMVGE